jgi:Male gamete fusion factor
VNWATVHYGTLPHSAARTQRFSDAALWLTRVGGMQMYLTAADGAAAAECTAGLLDSQGELTDSRIVEFSVNATQTDPLAQSDGTRESLNGGDSGARTCADKCANVFSLLCFWWKGCTAALIKGISLIVVMIFFGARPCLAAM